VTAGNVRGDHSPDNVKFPDITLTVCDNPPWHSACYARTSVTVSGMGRNATVHDSKPYI